ncbi:hypothetical protein EVAR_98596_1 [Eumeta japonica]|uniref:Uncharacterized protein n=1 Tax=Eumeta variegata TaxID=151549 RepID=A0A4C1XWR9_EUMVA|nr:hypothetical protein EVAR_98596_1 [Eumeta japonica]
MGEKSAPRADPAPPREAIRRGPPESTPARPLSQITLGFAEDIKTVMSVLRAVKSSEISEFARDIRACRSSEEKLLVLVNYHHLMCTKEYGLDLVLVQETFLKPSRPRSCALPGYVQLRTDRTDAPLGGTAIYYKRSLHCCPIDLPTLSNIEAKVVKS